MTRDTQHLYQHRHWTFRTYQPTEIAQDQCEQVTRGIMEQSTRSVALVLLALAAYATLCRGAAGANGEQLADDEIRLVREQVFVDLGNGTTLSLMVEPDETVQDFLADIYEIEGVSWYRRHLKLGDIELSDFNAKLYECNIRAGSKLTLVVPDDENRSLTKFTVKTRDDREYQVETLNKNSVASVKENIARLTGIPQAAQRLLLRGSELKDELQLLHYEIYAGMVLLGRPLEECRQSQVTILVKTLSGATIEVEANSAETVNDLKERIWQKAGVPVGVQRLSSSERLIAGNDHLCDLGLDADPYVYMYLYSSRITSLEQVARLAEPFVDPHKAPIFREVEGENAESVRRPASVYKDARNWLVSSDPKLPRGGPRPGWNLNLFDPTAHLSPNPDGELWLKIHREKFESLSQSDDGSDQLRAAIIRAQIRLSSAIRKHRVAANLISEDPRQQPGMTLAGRFVGASSMQPIPLGADVDNWAPDAFSDADIMRLFEVSERVRQVLARAARTGEGILSIASQRQINQAILFAYLSALDGGPPSVEFSQSGEDEQCGICRDNLAAEPAMKLACEHAFHADCVHSWVANLYQQKLIPSCPSCRLRFMFPYEALGKAELDKPELQDSQES